MLKSTQKLPSAAVVDSNDQNSLPTRQTKQLNVLLADTNPKHVPSSVEDQQVFSNVILEITTYAFAFVACQAE